MPKYSIETRTHLAKARESALLAVEIYNRPQSNFRSGGFIVMMCIAWTALFHAIFFNIKKRPFYRQKEHRGRFEMLDGDKKAWELSTCISEFWGASNPPERDNLGFFVKLRNKIEHRSMPALDLSIFGECQAFLFNFEDLLVSKFGNQNALNESLSLSLQFSCIRSDQQDKSIRKLHGLLAKDIGKYLDAFRSSLSTEVLQDPRFSYKVFLIPKPANHESSSDIAVEFVKFDATKPEQMDRYEKIVTLIKPSAAPLVNPNISVEATLSEGVSMRLVNDPNAPTFRPINYDDDYPFRQKEVLREVSNAFPDRSKINSRDIVVVRQVYKIDSDARYFYKPKFASPQYSPSFVAWLVDSYVADPDFFTNARSKHQTIERA